MLKTRFVTAIAALAFIAIVLFLLPRTWAEVVIGLLMVAGAWEWSGFFANGRAGVRIGYTLLVAVCIAFAHTLTPAQAAIVLEIACAWWIVAFLWVLRFPTGIPVVVRWVCGLLVIVPLFVALFMLLRLGVEYLIMTLLIVWLADGGAYFAGKAFGRVKLAPAISPGKTWEGAIGGMILVAALATAVALWQDISIAILVPFCVAVAAISIVGDLTVSMFKRTVGMKDSGSLFPGHGGVLDRIDSVAAAAPLFALGLSWLRIAA
jgi:phosphatidate cytidylyltransferase